MADMNATLILAIVFLYFVVFLVVAFVTGRRADAQSFFIGNRASRWYIVAYGMIGTSLSGVTFVSVPGEVGVHQWAYFQIVLGYLLGYWVVAFVLLPLYYRLQLTSIYTYLLGRFGPVAYKTGASFFLLSRTLGASARIYLVINLLQTFVLEPLHISFSLATAVIILMILLYTLKGGVKTIVWTDMLQTTCMLASLVISIYLVADHLQLGLGELWQRAQRYELLTIFEWNWQDKHFFVKQLLSGMFITIAMTGLDQEMMQKNISCRNLRESQANMLTFSMILVAVNLLFLLLGAVLYVFVYETGFAAPAHTDQLFPELALRTLGQLAGVVFLIGLISALYPSADGALTALTSSFCIDILGLSRRTGLSESQRTRIRYAVHVGFALVFFASVLIFEIFNRTALITTVLTLAGYTYGPLLGLYTFGLVTRRLILDRWSVWVCLLAPLACFWISRNTAQWFGGYQMGFELLLLNGLLTFVGLWLISRPRTAAA